MGEYKHVFLHFVPYGPNSASILNLLKLSDRYDHKIVIYGKNLKGIPDCQRSCENLIFGFRGNLSKIIMLSKHSKGVIFHSLFKREVVLFLFFFRSILKKSNWIAWGADIYSKRDPNTSLKGKMVFVLQSSFVRKIKFLTTLADGDYEVAKEYFGVKSLHLRGLYAIPLDDEEKSQKSVDIVKQPETINIHVGNNATQTNDHIAILNMLKIYKDQNIRIFVPLSYGDKKYARQIVKIGEDIFGSKFIPLTEFIPLEDYLKHLQQMQIGIFGNTRQQGMGNIYRLLFYGAKVFLREDTTMWHKFVEDEDFLISRVEDINSLDFDAFIDWNGNDANRNIGRYVELRSKKYIENIWDEIFETMETK